jgi:hypothetical protein
MDWMPRTNIPMNGGDVNFTLSDTYGNTDDGVSGGTWYFGRKWTGVIGTTPAPRDRGQGGVAHHIDVRYDDADMGSGFGQALLGRIVMTGAFKGGRIGTHGEVNQQHAADPAQANYNYVGLQGSAITHTGDGGANLTTGAKGSYFGIGSEAYAYAAAANLVTMCSIEANIFMEAGASAKFVVGVSSNAANAEHGSVVDAAFDIGGQNDPGIANHVGWNHGILFTDHHGGEAVHSGSILIGWHWENGPARTILHGIDLSGFAITGSIIQGQRSLLDEVKLVLGADGTSTSSILAGNGSTNAHLALVAKGSGVVRLRDGGGVDRVMADSGYGVVFMPIASPTAPPANGQVLIEKTSNTSLTFRMRGSDGTVRAASLTLA